MISHDTLRVSVMAYHSDGDAIIALASILKRIRPRLLPPCLEIVTHMSIGASLTSQTISVKSGGNPMAFATTRATTRSQIEKQISGFDLQGKIDHLLDFIGYILPGDEPAVLLAAHSSLALTKTEVLYFHTLSQPLGRIVCYDTLLEKCHPKIGKDYTTNNCFKYINRLRSKLVGKDITINNYRSLGWQMESGGSFHFPWDTSGGTARQISAPLDFYLDHLEHFARERDSLHLTRAA